MKTNLNLIKGKVDKPKKIRKTIIKYTKNDRLNLAIPYIKYWIINEVPYPKIASYLKKITLNQVKYIAR